MRRVCRVAAPLLGRSRSALQLPPAPAAAAAAAPLPLLLRRSISVWLKTDDWINQSLADAEAAGDDEAALAAVRETFKAKLEGSSGWLSSSSSSSSSPEEAHEQQEDQQQEYALLILPDPVDADAALLWRYTLPLNEPVDTRRPDAAGVELPELIPREEDRVDILFARQNSEEEEEEGQEEEREESAGAPFSEAGGADGGSRSRWLPYQEGDLLVAKRRTSMHECECLRVASMESGAAPWEHLVYADEGDSDFGGGQDVGARAMHMTAADRGALLRPQRRRSWEPEQPLLLAAEGLKEGTPVGDVAERVREALSVAAAAAAGGEAGGGGAGTGAGASASTAAAAAAAADASNGGFDGPVTFLVGGEPVSPDESLGKGVLRRGGASAELMLANGLRLPINCGLPLQPYAPIGDHPRGDEAVRVVLHGNGGRRKKEEGKGWLGELFSWVPM
jgi:hypothetical protein